MKRMLSLSMILGLGLQMVGGHNSRPAHAAKIANPQARKAVTTPAQDIKQLKVELAAKYPAERVRLERGIDQVAALWRPDDGDLGAFVREHFLVDPKQRELTFQRLEYALEQLDGHMNEIGRELRRPLELDEGTLVPLDPLLGAYDVTAHLIADLFDNKVAFVALLNFPLTSLGDRLANAPRYSRQEFAEVRLTSRFARRVPAEVLRDIAQAQADADLYIAEYNVWMHHLVTSAGERPFARGLRLISHWNLRDELKSAYADPSPAGRLRQRLIIQVMERIVTQTIPACVIDNPAVDWDPESNRVVAAPAAEVEPGGRPRPAAPAPEPDTRYRHLLAQYQAGRKADPYSPIAPTVIERRFETREMDEARVVGLLKEVLESDLVPKVAALIAQRLGRPLAPQDLWYDGFRPRARFAEGELDAMTRRRYPDAAAFAKDIPRILTALGFPKERVDFISHHIVVDPSRGAGHALGAARRGDDPHLRTRIEKDGMNYKGYNIAVHELGHNVEQVISLYEVDHTLLQGVPNNAFTEALAFVFQARDLELLGLAKPDAESERLRVLNDFWQTFEIAGVALVDIAAWHWMYDHPKATPAELREAVVRLAKEQWNRYYAPLLGQKDSPLLGIYSHMISNPIYLPDYPLGHLIAFQIEEHMAKQGPGSLGREFERMVKQGAVTPDVWMMHATGAKVEAGPLLRATARALAAGK